jgi:phosphoribosyl 1,2-cyclic phosphodiesterase
MRFCSLGSGSEGNGLVVESGDTRVLIDCGFGIRDTTFRLARAGIDPQGLTAIIVTHEHADHVGGVPAFAGRHGIAVWGSWGTLAVVATRFEGLDRVQGFDSHVPFSIGDLEITPVPVPHDAREPTQFVLGDGAVRLGVLTDLGVSTPHVEACLSGCDALVLETNHCLDLLAESGYPYPLKQRIAGRLGHLDNRSSAALLGRIDTTRLRHVVAAHLSQQNNTPGKARSALAGALGCGEDWIGVASQAEGFGWRDL